MLLILGNIIGDIIILGIYMLLTHKKRKSERAVINAAKAMFTGSEKGDFHNLREAVKNLK